MRTLTLCVLIAAAIGGSLHAWELDCYPESIRTDAQGLPLEVDRPNRRTAAFFAFDRDKHALQLRCGRGGYASFQLVVSDPKGGKFKVDFDQPSGVQVELFREFYSLNSKDRRWYPDALVPMKPGEAQMLPTEDNGIRGQTAQAFWVDVWVPTARRENGHFTLYVWCGHVRQPIDVDVVVDTIVYPEEDAITADHNCYGIGFVGSSHPAVVKKVQSNFGLSDPCFRLIQSYHRIFYEHRGSFHQLGYNHSGGVHPAFAPELEGDGAARRVRSWDVFDRHYGPLLDGSAFTGTRRGPRPVEGVYLPINPEWPARYFQWGSPAYEAEFVNVVAEMEQHFREKGWTRTGFELFFNHKKRYKGFGWDGDETRFPQDDAYFKLYGAWLQKACPPESTVKFRFRHDASWRMRGQADTLAGIVNHWVFAGFLSIYPELPKLVKRRGDLAWIYGGTNGVYGPVAEIAELPYRTWLMGLDGYTRWLSVDGLSRVPLKDYNGDTCQVYSGEQFGIDGPIPSIRLKLERNILQDVALLKAAERKAKEETERGEEFRGRVAEIFGLRLADLWRPDSQLKRQQPWEWSNASFAGNTGAGLFDRTTPDGDLIDRVRHFAFDAYASMRVSAKGVGAFKVEPAPDPMAGYKPPAAPKESLPEPPKPEQAAFLNELKRIGDLCVKEVDAAQCLKIVPEKVVPLLFKKDPRDPWADSDNYDVNAEPFGHVKQQLAKIAHDQANYPLDCNLWLVLTQEPLLVHACIRQIYGRSLFYKWGDLHGRPEDEQKTVLNSGSTIVAARAGDGPSAVLAPLKVDGKVIGWVEVCARYDDFAKAPVKK